METVQICLRQADNWETLAKSPMGQHHQAKIEYLVSYWRLLAQMRAMIFLQGCAEPDNLLPN